MCDIGSITVWVRQLQDSPDDATRHLWHRYYGRLVELARARLAGVPRRAADEEDVALSAFASFCRGATAGRFPQLADRHDLWAILLRLTERKAIDLMRHERRLRRGRGRVREDSALRLPERCGETAVGFEGVHDPEPGPEQVAALGDELTRLLGRLDAEQRRIALLKLEGYSNPEVAALLDRPLRTVERKLALIRKVWKESEEA